MNAFVEGFSSKAMSVDLIVRGNKILTPLFPRNKVIWLGICVRIGWASFKAIAPDLIHTRSGERESQK